MFDPDPGLEYLVGSIPGDPTEGLGPMGLVTAAVLAARTSDLSFLYPSIQVPSTE